MMHRATVHGLRSRWRWAWPDAAERRRPAMRRIRLLWRRRRAFARLALCKSALPATLPATLPPEAAAVGYTVNTFHSTFDRKRIDLADSRAAGFQWYLGQFFGFPATAAGTVSFNTDGSVTILPLVDSGSGINSAAPRGKDWVGMAFGGGAYFEATLKFNPQDVIATKGKGGWPAWWSMSIEHFAFLPGEQWPGQEPGYAHFAEPDFFEYDIWEFSPHHWYGGAVHDWWGVWKKTAPDGYGNVSNAPGGGTNFGNFQVKTPEGTDFTQYHRFGFLWVPATLRRRGMPPTSSTAGRRMSRCLGNSTPTRPSARQGAVDVRDPGSGSMWRSCLVRGPSSR